MQQALDVEGDHIEWNFDISIITLYVPINVIGKVLFIYWIIAGKLYNNINWTPDYVQFVNFKNWSEGIFHSQLAPAILFSRQVFVRLPHTVKVSDEFLEGVVVANMTNWRHVYGNCTLKLQLATHDKNTLPSEYTNVSQEFIEDVSKGRMRQTGTIASLL